MLGAFGKEKALVGAFSLTVKFRESSFTAIIRND